MNCLHNKTKEITYLCPKVNPKLLQAYSLKAEPKSTKSPKNFLQKSIFDNQNPHFENGFARYRNDFLRSSIDSIEEKEKNHYLELFKQETRGKMKALSSKNFQENGSNGILE